MDSDNSHSFYKIHIYFQHLVWQWLKEKNLIHFEINFYVSHNKLIVIVSKILSLTVFS